MNKKRPRLLLAVLSGVFTSVLIAGPATPTDVVTGPGPGGGPDVKRFCGTDCWNNFMAYSIGFSGGVRVATGFFNADEAADIVTGAGPTGGPHIKVFDQNACCPGLMDDFFAYDPGFTGGVYVATGDVNGDGVSDIITGADSGGGPHVKVFNGTDLTGATVLASFFPYEVGFGGGVRVAAADLDQDGCHDVITGAGPGGGPHVKAYDLGLGADGCGPAGSLTELASFFPYPVGFGGGVFVAGGNVFNNSDRDIVVGPGAGFSPEVRIFEAVPNNSITVNPGPTFLAYAPAFTGGVRVAVGDIDGDCCPDEDDIITGAGPGGGPHVKTFSGDSLVEMDSWFAYQTSFRGGVYVSDISQTAETSTANV